MDFYKLFILQLIGHILADFFFQSDLWSRHKRRYGFRSKIMYWHVLIVFLTSYVLSFQWNFIWASGLILFIHLLVDALKLNIGRIKIDKSNPFRNFTFFIDQILHILTIWFVVYIFSKYATINPVINISVANSTLVIVLAYLLCLKPTNILIREVFSIYRIKIKKQPDEDLLNAGKLIGNIERILTLTLLLIGQYEAIGFIIAGKSILRYEGVKTSKTEYVLIGTLLSFGIAILIGIIVTKINI
ncbi:MAG: DUF3307 domain-containing protein [Bacteroidales bacterium]|jgi:hypothetical protein|nr:DUF3307 domain-containing protein [Bacteroidales bacterium]